MQITDRSSLTNKEVIQAFREYTDSTGHVSDDSSWSNRLLLRHLLFYRAPLLAQKVNSGDNSYRRARQTIPCIPLVEVDTNECPCAPQSGCTWMRTKYRIPDPIGKFITVTSIDGGIMYGYRNWDDVKSKFDSRVPAISKGATYSDKNGYLYLHNDIHKEFITITAVFLDPRQAQLFIGCDGEEKKCVKPLDLEFPFDPELYPMLYQMVFQQLFAVKGSVPGDVINDDLPEIARRK